MTFAATLVLLLLASPVFTGLVVDSDCGVDDAMALVLLAEAEARGLLHAWGPLEAVTTVTGNTGAYNASRNVRVVLDSLRLAGVEVYPGNEDSLAGGCAPTGYYGSDGFGDFLPPQRSASPRERPSAATFLADHVAKHPNETTLLCLGPLTNVALALHLYPSLLKDLRHVIIVGGSYQGGGNMGVGAEANMFVDPEAAAYVFSKALDAPSKITLLPYEAVQQDKLPMGFRKETLGRMKGGPMGLVNRAEETSLTRPRELWPCYDPTAAGMLVEPDLVVTSEPVSVQVVTQGPRGAMFASLNSSTPNVRLITRIDKLLLMNLLKHLLKSDTETKQERHWWSED